MQSSAVGPYKKSNEVLPRHAEHAGYGNRTKRTAAMSWRRYIAPYVDNVPDTENPVSIYTVRLSILHRRTEPNEVWTHVWT